MSGDETKSLNLDIKILPEIDDESFLCYLKKVNDTTVTDRICNELDVRNTTKNYFKDLYLKIKHFISKEKERFRLLKEPDFFKDQPMFNLKDMHQYVILLGSPFVEKAKQDKFKMYLTTKSVLTEFASMVKGIYFPYEDSDKPSLANGAMVIIKFDSIEEARLVRQTIDGKFIMKNSQGHSLLFDEFIQLVNYNKIEKDEEKAQKFIENLKVCHEWEKETLEELYIKRNDKLFQQCSLHYLRKEIKPLHEGCELKECDTLNWSPNGTFLIKNCGNSIEFFSGNKTLEKVLEIPENCQSLKVSNDEKYMISFLGLGNTNLISDPDYIKDLITRQNVFIWDIYRTQIIKSIRIGNDEDFSNFKFSDDSKYLGRLKNDTLMIYEAPEYKMLMDNFLNKRHPLTDKVTKYHWFPNRNYIMTIQEVRNHRNLDTRLEFYQIPSRRKCDLSIPFTNVQVVNFKWHPNNKVLVLLLKTMNIPEWSIRIIEFNFNNFSHKSKNYQVIKPVVRNKKEETMTEKDIDYNSVDVFWLDNGNEIMITAKKRLLIPYYSMTDKKYNMSDNGYSISIIMYKFNNKDLKATPWPEEKNKLNLKFDSVEVSPSGKNFIFYKKRFEERDSYGMGIIYSIDNEEIHNIASLNFEDKFSNIRFDQSGRFFAIELSRVHMENYTSKGYKIFYISGDMIAEDKDENLREVIF